MKIPKIGTNRIALAIGAGIVASGAVAASAATLGSLTPQSLGTSSAAVSGCQDGGLTVSWGAPTYSAAEPTYKVDEATLGGIAPTCNNKPYRMTIATSAGTSLTEVTGSTGAGGSVTPTFTPVDSASIGRVTVVIYG